MDELKRKIDQAALMRLKRYRRQLTFQQYKTLRGQVLAGNSVGAIKGLRRILNRKGAGTNEKSSNNHA